MAPPPDFPDDEDGAGSSSSQSQTQISKTDHDSETSAQSGDESKDKQTGGTNKGEVEKVLVHRNGKFELLSQKELTAEEREMYLGPQHGKKEDEVGSEASSGQCSADNGTGEHWMHQPRPPGGARPHTANGTSGSRRATSAKQKPRAQSAQQQRSSSSAGMEWGEDFNYDSPYALTPEERKKMAREQREKDKQKREEEEQKKKEEEKRKQESNDAFNAWLKKKRDEQKEIREEERREQEEERQKREKEKEEKVLNIITSTILKHQYYT